MLTEERHSLILSYVKSNGTAKIQELVDLTGSSESTIRRDLTELERKKQIKRLHGGASALTGKLQELSVPEKTGRRTAEKERIGHFAASLIEDGDCIFLDAGTTTQKMIAALPDREVVIVTNGLMHLEALQERGLTTYLLGGLIKPKTNAVIGRGALEAMRNYRFDKAFLGANGVHPEFGYTTPDPEEAQVKELAIALARESFVLADDSKVGDISFAKFGDIGDASLITTALEKDMEACLTIKTMVKVVLE